MVASVQEYSSLSCQPVPFWHHLSSQVSLCAHNRSCRSSTSSRLLAGQGVSRPSKWSIRSFSRGSIDLNFPNLPFQFWTFKALNCCCSPARWPAEPLSSDILNGMDFLLTGIEASQLPSLIAFLPGREGLREGDKIDLTFVLAIEPKQIKTSAAPACIPSRFPGSDRGS